MTAGYQSNISQYQIVLGSNNKNLKTISNGTSGYVLTSNGSSSDPSFQAYPSPTKYALTVESARGTLAASTTYFLPQGLVISGFTSSGNASTRIYFPQTGTITKCYFGFREEAGGTSNTYTLSLRLNNTSDTTIDSAINLSSTGYAGSNTALSIAVSAGDYVEYKLMTPSGTAPTNVSFTGTILIQ